MRNLLAILLIPTTTIGCVVYDNDGPGDGPDVDIGRDYEDIGEDPGAEETGYSLAFEPVQAEQGESFIGYITVEEGEFDLNDVASIKSYGDAFLGTWDTRQDEVILSVSVPADAVEGEVDMVVEFQDGSAIWIEAALTVYPAGSGNSCEDGYNLADSSSGDDGGSNDGSSGDGSGSDGSGDGGSDDGGCE